MAKRQPCVLEPREALSRHLAACLGVSWAVRGEVRGRANPVAGSLQRQREVRWLSCSSTHREPPIIATNLFPVVRQ